jgi:DNA replication protein DnaC
VNDIERLFDRLISAARTEPPRLAECLRHRAPLPCDECAADAAREHLARLGVPASLAHATLANFCAAAKPSAAALRACQAYVAERPLQGWLLLMSQQCGVGKSHLAVSVLRAYGRGFLLTHAEFIRRARENYSRVGEDIVRRCQRVPLLVLDDLGIALHGQDEKPLLAEVILRRYDEMLPLILTTNLDSAGLADLLGARIGDRMKERAVVVELSGPSYRPRKGQDII